MIPLWRSGLTGGDKIPADRAEFPAHPRRELDKVVRTVFFNDPSLTLESVLLKL
jgi:hypothetical protein